MDNCSSLVLGTRTFDSKDIPWKSRLGNKITIQTFKFASGVKINDTQTGLRGIPRLLMATMLEVKYDRFEFEMQMLFDTHAHLDDGRFDKDREEVIKICADWLQSDRPLLEIEGQC